MEHVVFFPAPDGSPAFRRVGTLEEAVRLVEHLRNAEGVAEVAVHPLGAEVPLAFRAFYRVELPGVEAAAAAPEPAASQPVVEPVAQHVVEPVAERVVEQVVPAQVEPVAEEVPVLVEASSNGHADDGVKSLGFFA